MTLLLTHLMFYHYSTDKIDYFMDGGSREKEKQL